MIDKNVLLRDIQNLIFDINPEITYTDKMNFAEQGIDSLDYAFIVVNLEKKHNVDVLNLDIPWNTILTPVDLAQVFLRECPDG
jgi:acyl carrier protein